MRCDIVAEGVVEASNELKVSKPIVIRLVGTNVEAGKKIIKDSGLAVYPEDDLNKAAKLQEISCCFTADIVAFGHSQSPFHCSDLKR